MSTGTVKFFNSTKGFGFIIDDKSKKEIFVHASGLIDQISQDDKVSFDLVDGKKGPNCVDVKKIG
jgi:CspA family cold shock protein